mmetsp:Transcript_35673/g.83483  ORF Transcript_35673/g.83483 Transcript_35673/m.83483 type:complete len:402 (+) Transcript_35673:93-1298(+)
MAGASNEALQLAMLKFFEQGLLSDVTLVAQGREIRAHKAVLAAQSQYLCKQFSETPTEVMEVPDMKYKVLRSLVRFMYFGGLQADDLTPDELLDLFLVAQDFAVHALDPAELEPAIVERLTPHNCLATLQHDGLSRSRKLQDAVCDFVGMHFQQMHREKGEQLLMIPRHLLAAVLRTACRYVLTDQDSQRLVQFCLSHTQLESACDLLRETKHWHWGGDEEVSILKAPADEAPSEGAEWVIHGVRAAMESAPARIVVGNFFDWCIRLDYGAEGKLRIVYESATPRDGEPRCINRFPAAMFAWRVFYRGQDVFAEKPVFICFPENVSLHWSTTLPVSASDLSDDDELRIMVNMAENPMLSLVLYYFSADLKTTVFSEDILNRLPHIEYRCLSSYSLVKTHSQ